MRNDAYHSDMLLTPSHENVEKGLSYSKALFNELRPDHKLQTEEIALSTEQVIKEWAKEYAVAKENNLHQLFANLDQENGYEIRNNPNLGAGLRPDLMVLKNITIILYKSKSVADNVTLNTLAYLNTIVNMLRDRNRELYIEPRIIAPGKFNPRIMSTAADYGITLIDDGNLREYL